jgi:methylenetetrahydrofolate reductase (NADPH)
MPIQNYSSFQRMTSYCRTTVPQHIWSVIQPIADNDEAVKAFGVQLCTSMCQEMIAKGIKGFHFYTLNLENSVLNVLKALHVEDTTAVRRSVPTPPPSPPSHPSLETFRGVALDQT